MPLYYFKIRKLIKLVFLGFICSLSISAFGANEDPIKIKLQSIADNYLKKYSTNEHISAVEVSVSSNDIKNILTVYSGMGEFGGKVLLQASNLFQIGSITKSFIAVILLQLEADPENHFSINDPLKKYFPQYEKWGDVTVKQLLNMTSGIPNYTENNIFAADLAKDPMKNRKPEELVAYAYEEPQNVKGNKYYYSNTNYILAGMIISKLTGHSVEEEMKLRFFDEDNLSHLNLKNTYYIGHLYPSSIVHRLAHGYYFKTEGIFPPETDATSYSLSWGGAAGANVSNTEDIIYWVKGLYNSLDVLPMTQRNELLSVVSTLTGNPIKTVTADDPNGFGLGIGVSFDSDNPKDIIYNYEGGTLGYRAFYIYIPTRNIIISVATNSAVINDDDHLGELLGEIYAYLIGSENHVPIGKNVLPLKI